MKKRYNILRGYMKLRVWQDAKEYYCLASTIYADQPLPFLRVFSNQIACVDSIHRNIAEGYCRKSKKEYIRFLDIAAGSLGESTSGNHVYQNSNQISHDQFESLDIIAFKLENSLRKLLSSLRTLSDDQWSGVLDVREAVTGYNQVESKRKERWKEWNELSNSST